MDATLQSEMGEIVGEIEKIDSVVATKLRYVIASLESDVNVKDVRRGFSAISNINVSQLESDCFQYYRSQGVGHRFIEIIRNFMVFIPILFTWTGLYFSLDAYSQFLHSTNNQSESFLFLWQTGFGGILSRWLYFSNIALLDAFFIGIIILLSIISSSREENAIEKAFSFKKRVEKVIWNLDEELFERYNSLVIAEGTLESVVLQLQSLTVVWQNRSEDLCNFLAAEHERLEKFSEVQASELTSLKQAGTTFYEASRIVVDVINGLKTQISSWADITVSHTSIFSESSSDIQSILGYTRVLQENGTLIGSKINDLAKMEIRVLDKFDRTSARFADNAEVINSTLQNMVEEIGKVNVRIDSFESYVSQLTKTQSIPKDGRVIELLESIDRRLAINKGFSSYVESENIPFHSKVVVNPTTLQPQNNKDFSGYSESDNSLPHLKEVVNPTTSQPQNNKVLSGFSESENTPLRPKVGMNPTISQPQNNRDPAGYIQKENNSSHPKVIAKPTTSQPPNLLEKLFPSLNKRNKKDER